VSFWSLFSWTNLLTCYNIRKKIVSVSAHWSKLCHRQIVFLLFFDSNCLSSWVSPHSWSFSLNGVTWAITHLSYWFLVVLANGHPECSSVQTERLPSVMQKKYSKESWLAHYCIFRYCLCQLTSFDYHVSSFHTLFSTSRHWDATKAFWHSAVMFSIGPAGFWWLQSRCRSCTERL
jgi:hypothetical protein